MLEGGGGRNRKGKINDLNLQSATDFTNEWDQTDRRWQRGMQAWSASQNEREALAAFDKSDYESEDGEKINKILADPTKREPLITLGRFFEKKETQSTLREFERLSQDEGVQSLIQEFAVLSGGKESIEKMKKTDERLQQVYTETTKKSIKELLNELEETFENLNNYRGKVVDTIARHQAKSRIKIDYQNKSLEDWMQSQNPLSPEEEMIIEEANEALHTIPNPYLENATHLEIAALVKADRDFLLSERVATYLIMQRIPSITGKWDFEYIVKNGQRWRANREEQRANVLTFFETRMPGALKGYYAAFADRIGGIEEEIEEHTQAREEVLQSIQLDGRYKKLAETIKALEETKRECQVVQQELPKEIETAKQALLKVQESDEKEAKEAALKKLQQLQEKRDELNKQVQDNESKLNLAKMDKEAVLLKMTPEERNKKIQEENEERKMEIEAMEVDIQKGDNLALQMRYKEIQIEIDELQKRKNHYENVQKTKEEVQKAWNAAEHDPEHENKKGLKEWLHSLEQEKATLAIGEGEWTEGLPILLAKRAEMLERIALLPEVEGEPFDIINLKKKISLLDKESETLSQEISLSEGSKERVNTIKIERRKHLEELGSVIAGPKKRYSLIVIPPPIEERIKMFLEDRKKKGLRGEASIVLEDNLGVDMMQLVAGVVPRKINYAGVISKTPEMVLKMFKHLLDLEKVVSEVHREFTTNLEKSGDASSVEINLDKVFKKVEEIKKEMEMKPTYSYVSAAEVTSEEIDVFFKNMRTHISSVIRFLGLHVRSKDIKRAGLDLGKLQLDKSQLRQRGTSRFTSNYKWAEKEVKKENPAIVINPNRMHEEVKFFLRHTAAQRLKNIDDAQDNLPKLELDIQAAMQRGETPLLIRKENKKEVEEIITAERERELAEKEGRRKKVMLLEYLQVDVVSTHAEVSTTDNKQVVQSRTVLNQYQRFQQMSLDNVDDEEPSTSLKMTEKKKTALLA